MGGNTRATEQDAMFGRIAKILKVSARVRALGVAALLAATVLAARPSAARAQQQPQSAPDGMGGSGTPNLSIKLPELPSISMIAVPSYGVGPLTVGFFANGVDPKGKGFVSYLWTFGDGGVSMDPPMMFFHIYKNPGTYIATVTATTADGRTATSYTGIIVRPRSH
jgi:PKD domain